MRATRPLPPAPSCARTIHTVGDLIRITQALIRASGSDFRTSDEATEQEPHESACASKCEGEGTEAAE
jgi:hypothetical protein